jgi:hypothetical protein
MHFRKETFPADGTKSDTNKIKQANNRIVGSLSLSDTEDTTGGAGKTKEVGKR